MLFDNLNSHLSSESLCAVITSHRYQSRLMHTNDFGAYNNLTAWGLAPTMVVSAMISNAVLFLYGKMLSWLIHVAVTMASTNTRLLIIGQ